MRNEIISTICVASFMIASLGCSSEKKGTSPNQPNPLTFDRSPDYQMAGDPRAIRIADIDADGDLDIVVVCLGHDSSSASVFINGGDRMITPGPRYKFSSGANDAEFGDFDKDGDLDLVVAASPSVLLMNDGSGGFSVRNLGLTAWFVDVGDLDADGDADLAFGMNTPTDKPLVVLVNDGAANFTQGFSANTSGTAPTNVALADFTGDGRLDIAVCNAMGANVVLFLLTGTGPSWGWSPEALPAGIYPYSIVTADVDGDGDQDIIVGNLDSDDISVYKTPTPGSESEKPHQFPAGGYPRDLTCADLDHDGYSDIVTSDWNDVTSDWSDIIILINNGSGEFTTVLREDLTGEIRAVVAADLDGDGRIDIIAGNTSGLLDILYGRP